MTAVLEQAGLRSRPWPLVKLKDVCTEVTVGHVGPMASEYVESGIPFLRSQNIAPFRINPDGLKFISEGFHRKLKKSAISTGDVVIVRTGYPGTACVVPATLGVANCADLVIVRPRKNEIDPWFLSAIFNSAWGRGTVAGSLVGVAQQHFNVGVAKEMTLSLPPIQTQQKISSILSAYDDLIENNTRRIQILEDIARSLYEEWFVRFRFPGHEKVEMVDSELGPVPDGWEIRSIQDVSNVLRGRSYKGTDLVDEGGLPFLNLKCIDRDGGFRYDGIKNYKGPFKETQTATAGDIVMAVTDMTQERRIVARAARVPDAGFDLWVLSMDLVKIQPHVASDASYLYGMLRFSSFPDEVKQYANGANVLHLNPERIVRFRFTYAPEALRKNFGSVVQPSLEQSDALNRKSAILRQTRDLLLPKLISGEVDVSNLDIPTEVAGA